MISIKKNKSKGSLLFELLIVISIIAIIFAVSSNAMFLSLRSNKVVGDRDTAMSLASETLEAMRSVADEDWMNIYNTTKDSQHYKLAQSSNKWVIQTGDENVTVNGITYTRYFIISNVSRDSSSNNIESTYNSSNDDPGTQKVTVTVSWTNGNPVTISDYFYRWKNKVCSQGGWTTGGSGTTVKNCSDTTYDTADSSLDVSGGTLKLK